MAWDATRPVPWRRMVNEWLIYVGLMFVLVLIFFDDQPLAGVLGGVLVSGPLYLGFGYVLAKLGYRRKSLRELRAESGRAPEPEPNAGAVAGPRPKPAPTSRTGGGSGRPGGKRKKR